MILPYFMLIHILIRFVNFFNRQLHYLTQKDVQNSIRRGMYNRLFFSFSWLYKKNFVLLQTAEVQIIKE